MRACAYWYPSWYPTRDPVVLDWYPSTSLPKGGTGYRYQSGRRHDTDLEADVTRPSTRARIDWGAARAFFVALDPPRTRAAVARRFGVSEAAVRTHAKDEGWDELAQQADERAATKALERAGRTREERTAQLLRIYDRASQLVEDGLDADDPKLSLDQVFARFPDIHRIYRLETDQATDHMALAEVQAGFRSTMAVAIATVEAVAGELLGERKAAEVVRVFRLRFLPAVNEALAVGAGGGDG